MGDSCDGPLLESIEQLLPRDCRRPVVPIIGITLPFVSHGGSSMIAQWLMSGLVLSAALHRGGYEMGQRLNFEDAELE